MKLLLIAAVAAIAATTEARQLEAKRVDVPWVQERQTETFLATIPKSDTPCGSKFGHELACIYCVNGACGSGVARGGELMLHYETADSPACVNRFRILTEPNPNGACASFITSQAMITG